MSLITAHRILIGTAVVFFFLYGLWELRGYLETGNGWALLRALLGGGASVGWAAYLRTVKPRGRGKIEQ